VKTVSSVIDGSPVSGGRTVASRNPARLDEVVGEVALADAATFVRAAASAKKAQEGWAAVPAPVRGRAIAHIGRLIEDNAEALARLVTAEIGKPYEASPPLLFQYWRKAPPRLWPVCGK